MLLRYISIVKQAKVHLSFLMCLAKRSYTNSQGFINCIYRSPREGSRTRGHPHVGFHARIEFPELFQSHLLFSLYIRGAIVFPSTRVPLSFFCSRFFLRRQMLKTAFLLSVQTHSSSS